MKNFESYHWVWLSLHPSRTAEWLSERLSDGFHIHHVDGDHSNNDPRNLALIEGEDHLRIHGLDLRAAATTKKDAARAAAYSKGQEFYLARVAGKAWSDIGENVPTTMMTAKRYAEQSGSPWPIPGVLFRRPRGSKRDKEMRPAIRVV